MKRLLASILILSPFLHSEELGGIDLTVSQYFCAGSLANYNSNSKSQHNGQAIGIGVRVPDQDRIGNLWRITLEKDVHTYALDAPVSELKNSYSLSLDYLWGYSKKFHMGAGLRVINYKTIAPQSPSQSQYPVMSSAEYGNNVEYYPQFISAFRVANHVSLEVDISLARCDVQFRYSF